MWPISRAWIGFIGEFSIASVFCLNPAENAAENHNWIRNSSCCCCCCQLTIRRRRQMKYLSPFDRYKLQVPCLVLPSWSLQHRRPRDDSDDLRRRRRRRRWETKKQLRLLKIPARRRSLSGCSRAQKFCSFCWGFSIEIFLLKLLTSKSWEMNKVQKICLQFIIFNKYA